MASNADVAASEDASASIAFEDDFMVRIGEHAVDRNVCHRLMASRRF